MASSRSRFSFAERFLKIDGSLFLDICENSYRFYVEPEKSKTEETKQIEEARLNIVLYPFWQINQQFGSFKVNLSRQYIIIQKDI